MGLFSLDLTLPVNGSIDRTAPTWATNLQDSYIRIIDAFLSYDNVLAFNIGNEIVTSVNQTADAPFIKAAARDIKSYLSVYLLPSATTTTLTPYLVMLELPSRRLRLLATPPSMAMTH